MAKICLFGDAGVGKTSLVRRFVESTFSDAYVTTIGTNVKKKVVRIADPNSRQPVEFTLMVWDIVGQKNVRELVSEAYFEGAKGAIGVCDVTRRETLEDLDDWRKHIVKQTGEIPLVFLANKADLKNEMRFGVGELKGVLESYTNELGEGKLRRMLLRARDPCQLTSAKTGENVDKTFATLCETML